MRIWFDTEFLENGETIKLISIGMIREDGETFYAETGDAKWLVEESDWLRDNVKPHLTGNTLWPNVFIAERIKKFAGNKPEFWAYYCSYDWVVLCQLYGTMMDLPEGWPMFCRDVIQEAKRLNIRLPKQDTTKHNALSDAIWTKDAWQFLQDAEKALAAVSSK